jgi:trehalose-6-phosphate synthase
VAGARCCGRHAAYQRILRSFGAYDVVGFQTEADADNFRDCIAAANTGRAAGGDWCEIDGRRMQVRAFPIGIDSEAFAREARAAEKNSTVKRTLASLEGSALVIGVDRLDYSKGLKQRMEAFAMFLERSPQAVRARLTMLQITPKSRSEVPNNWSVFAEYRFTDFGRIRANGAAFGLPTGVFFNESRRIQQNQVQVGFSYKFDLLGPVPVVAKY